MAVTVGRLVPEKGHRYLLDCMAPVVSGYPGIRFVLVGDGPEGTELRRQVEASGLQQHVIFAGRCDDVPELLAAADLMVHPALEESFGIAVLEGLRAGLPVVATRVGGIPEVVGEEGAAVLVPPRDPAALGEAVLELCRDAGRRRALGDTGRRRWRERFTSERMLDRLETYFQEHLAGAGTYGSAQTA